MLPSVTASFDDTFPPARALPARIVPIRLAVRVRWLWLVVIVLVGLRLPAVESSAPPPILVAGTTDNYPYSFLDGNQQLTGFAVDVFEAAARQMQVKYTRVTGPAAEMADRFIAGELTVHPFFTKSTVRAIGVEYSVPYVVLQMTVFTRKGETRIKSLDDLARLPLKIAVGGAGLEYGRAHGIPETRLSRVANNEAFQWLSSGKVDAAIFTRLVGLAAIERLGLSNLTATDIVLPDAGREYRMAIKRGETQLLAQLNEGLAIIHRNGEFDGIYQKWFGRFEPRRFTREEVTVYVAVVLALALAITFWALLRQRQLRHSLKRQADELAESQAILAEAQQFARIGHWQRNLTTGELRWSDETFRIHERDPALGAPSMDELLSWVPPGDRILWETSARRARTEGVVYEFEMSIEPRIGIRRIVHIRGRPIRDRAGKITGLFGTVQDITSWREAEHALVQSERLLRALYENIPYAMGVMEHRSGAWRNVSVNPKTTQLLGLAHPPPAGLSLAEMGFSESQLKFWTDILDRTVAGGAPTSVERQSERSTREFIITIVPLGRSGDHHRCCFFVEDITTRKQREAEISQGRRLRALGELVGGIAHEFNNLLTPILLKADLLKSEWSHEPALVDDLQVIADTARRSADLTRRLLTFGRRTELRLSLFALASIVEANFKLLRPTIDRRIILEADVPENLPSLYLNSSDVQQIVLNLLLNSRDTLAEKLATPSEAAWSPLIRVTALALPPSAATPLDATKPSPPAWIKLTCEDNGLGMSAEVKERVFEPFYTTKQVGRGTGLGLATVWHLVTEMGGRVDVDSAPGQGTAFHIFLPALTPPEVATPAVTPHEAAPALPCAAGTKPHILLAEDEPYIADIVAHVLRHIGCDITHAADGTAAWKILSARPQGFDSLILDLNMPGVTGLELLRRARRAGTQCPVLITSGRVGDDERQELNALRATTILQKPFTVEQLIAALAEAGIQRTPKP